MKKIICAFLFITVIFACGRNKVNHSEVSEVQPVTAAFGIGKIEPKGGVSNLASPVAGIVSEIKASAGSYVKENDVLIVLDNTDASLNLSEINNSYAVQQKNLESSKVLLQQGLIRLSEAERKLQDSRELYEAGALARETLLTLENDLELEKQNHKKLQNDIALEQSKLNELAARRSMRNEALSRTALRAPMSGMVLDLLPKKGEAVHEYETYALLAPEAPLVVIAEIDEMFSTQIKIGQSCTITLSGSSNPVAKGKVAAISPDLKKKSLFADSGQDFQDRRVREIEISLDEDPQLLIDTKVECIVDLD